MADATSAVRLKRSKHASAHRTAGVHADSGSTPGARRAAAEAAGAAGSEAANATSAEPDPGLVRRAQAFTAGFAAPSLRRQFPYCSQETTVVAAAPKLGALRAMLEEAKTSAQSVGGLLAARDATIRQQRERIACLEEELARLRTA